MRYLVKTQDALWNKLMDDFFTPVSNQRSQSHRTPLVDIKDEKDSYLLEAELPGLDEKDIEIKVEENLLTLSAERKQDKKDEKQEFLTRERSTWSFKRSFVLPKDVNTKDIKASFDNGVLTLELPKKEETKPVLIEVKRKK